MRSIKFAAFAALFAVAGSMPVLAHAKMTASVPEDGASVASPVSEIAFTFSKPLRLTLVKVVRASDQQQMSLSGGLPKTVGTSVKTAVSPLPSGSYKVTWTAVAEDGHVMKGDFAFSVTAGAQPAK